MVIHGAPHSGHPPCLMGIVQNSSLGPITNLLSQEVIWPNVINKPMSNPFCQHAYGMPQVKNLLWHNSFYYIHLRSFSYCEFLSSTPGTLTQNVWKWTSGLSTSKSFLRWFWHNLFPAWHLGPTFTWPWLQKPMIVIAVSWYWDIGIAMPWYSYALGPFQGERKWRCHLPWGPRSFQLQRLLIKPLYPTIGQC